MLLARRIALALPLICRSPPTLDQLIWAHHQALSWLAGAPRRLEGRRRRPEHWHFDCAAGGQPSSAARAPRGSSASARAPERGLMNSGGAAQQL